VKVLHIYKDYYPVIGGIENHVRALAEAQARRGHDVTVLVTNRGRATVRQEMNRVQVIKAGRLATVASTPLSLALPRELCSLQADVLHVHSPYPVGEAAAWLWGQRRPTVISYHSDVVRQRRILALYAPALRRVLRAARRIIVTSPQVAATSPFLGPVAGKCRLVPLGIDTSRFLAVDPAQVATLQERLGQPLLLFVGRLRYYKGLQYLLRALVDLPGVHLAVAGTGPMGAEWKGLAGSLGLADRVTWLGDVADDDLPACYAAADLLVLPACERSEAFGLVQVEAMAAGRPVVSTELGTGTSFVNQHGETGLVVPPRDPQAIAWACRDLLADPDLRRHLGAQARRRALAEFGLERMVQRVEEVYEEAVCKA